MPLFRKIIFVALCLPALFSCRKTIDVNAGWQDITIVYGILNQSDSMHYIKITKAFLGPGDELEYARIPDSNNYAIPLQVKLEEYSGTSLLRSVSLRDTMITNKDSGMFYFPVQKLYFTKENLNAADHYQLSILNTQTNKVIAAQTDLVGEFAMQKPDYFYGVNLVPGKSCMVQWQSAAGGKRYQLTMRIQYSEYRYGDSAKTIHYLNWTPFTEVKSITDKGNQTMIYNIPGEEFYRFLSLNLAADPDITRSLGLCKFTFLVGSEALDTYLSVTVVSNTIIVSKPPFSNIDNGIGLFASRHTVSFDSLWFSDITKDSLKTNRYTKDLGF